jgi:hypothetical protein
MALSMRMDSDQVSNRKRGLPCMIHLEVQLCIVWRLGSQTLQGSPERLLQRPHIHLRMHASLQASRCSYILARRSPGDPASSVQLNVCVYTLQHSITVIALWHLTLAVGENITAARA